jgi:hypothetical protein
MVDSATAGFARTMFLDSDTIVRGSIQSALDALAVYDLAMVGEYASFSTAASYVYAPLLGVSNFYRPHVPDTKKKVKPEYAAFGAYEQQFNTGLVAFRSDSPCVLGLMRRWEGIHLANPVCRRDRVAWDQCSLPWALRESAVKVATLPQRLNFRQALGRGCAPDLYNTPGAEGRADRATVVHDMIKPAVKTLIQRSVLPGLLADGGSK